jgi:hypothetical protein
LIFVCPLLLQSLPSIAFAIAKGQWRQKSNKNIQIRTKAREVKTRRLLNMGHTIVVMVVMDGKKKEKT